MKKTDHKYVNKIKYLYLATLNKKNLWTCMSEHALHFWFAHSDSASWGESRGGGGWADRMQKPVGLTMKSGPNQFILTALTQ